MILRESLHLASTVDTAIAVMFLDGLPLRGRQIIPFCPTFSRSILLTLCSYSFRMFLIITPRIYSLTAFYATTLRACLDNIGMLFGIPLCSQTFFFLMRFVIFSTICAVFISMFLILLSPFYSKLFWIRSSCFFRIFFLQHSIFFAIRFTPASTLFQKSQRISRPSTLIVSATATPTDRIMPIFTSIIFAKRFHGKNILTPTTVLRSRKTIVHRPNSLMLVMIPSRGACDPPARDRRGQRSHDVHLDHRL